MHKNMETFIKVRIFELDKFSCKIISNAFTIYYRFNLTK